MDNMEIFNELIRKEPNLLDRPIKDLLPISFVGAAAVSAYRSLVSRLKDLPMTEEQKRKTLGDGQDAGKMLLAIEGRIGELLKPVREQPSVPLNANGKKGGTIPKPYPESITKAQRNTADIIASHPEEVAEVIKEAEENEDIPTKTAVLNKVRFKKEHERRKEAEKRDKPNIVLTIEQQQYINTLERVIGILPKEPPKDWQEKPFARAKGLALIIINRLKEFNDGQRNGSITE